MKAPLKASSCVQCMYVMQTIADSGTYNTITEIDGHLLLLLLLKLLPLLLSWM